MSKSAKRILVVDDDPDILTAAQLLLKRQFGEIITCVDPENIRQLMSDHSFAAVLLDMNFSPEEKNGKQGFIWLKRILNINPDVVVIMITAHGGVNVAVEAMKYGATDFICKPWQNEKVIATLNAAVKLHQSRIETTRLSQSNQLLIAASSGSNQNLLGSSKEMAEVHSVIRRAAATDANVLILGENGTGKDLVARELHQRSLRSNRIFMSVDLGAISENLFESELFGHNKGAFTGADKNRIGRLVAADSGTLFLDEIGNIPLHIQAKLLTVLEQRRVTPLGSNQSIDIDVRVIAATNTPVDALSNEQKFRQDLLFRLNTVVITVPPLRHRLDDIVEIALYYAKFYATKYSKTTKNFSSLALDAIKCYHWPGNVRALRHAVERAVILSESSQLDVIDLQLDQTISMNSYDNTSPGVTSDSAPSDTPENLHLETMEKRLVELALKKHRFNISKAANELGLTRATLYRRIEKYGF